MLNEVTAFIFSGFKETHHKPKVLIFDNCNHSIHIHAKTTINLSIHLSYCANRWLKNYIRMFYEDSVLHPKESGGGHLN